MDAAGVIATYVMDTSTSLSASFDRPLTAETGGSATFYLYGLGVIGEKTTEWNFSLPDGTNTPRQLTDMQGEITLFARYTPWGDSLELHGTGNFSFGYLGGVLDAATGLLYVGNGQYYDPSTGRFLTRDARPSSPNPYVPWNPIGAIVGPLGVIALVFGRRRKGSKAGTFLVLALVVGSVGMTLAGCGGGQPAPHPLPQPTAVPSNNNAPANPNPNETHQPGPSTDSGNVPSSTPSPVVTLTLPECSTPAWTPTPTLLPPPTNPTEAQKIEYIASFGIILSGNWTGMLLTNLWEALFVHIGYQNIKPWLNWSTATLVWGGARDCGGRDACYGGLTSGSSITFKATNTINPVINILHEFGHLVDNLWGDYFTSNLEKTTFYDERGNVLAGWDGSKYVSLPSDSSSALDVRKLALKSSTFGGQDAWQQRGGTPHWEDWADIFSNSMIHNINQTTDLGGQMNSFFVNMKNHVMGGTP